MFQVPVTIVFRKRKAHRSVLEPPAARDLVQIWQTQHQVQGPMSLHQKSEKAQTFQCVRGRRLKTNSITIQDLETTITLTRTLYWKSLRISEWGPVRAQIKRFQQYPDQDSTPMRRKFRKDQGGHLELRQNQAKSKLQTQDLPMIFQAPSLSYPKVNQAQSLYHRGHNHLGHNYNFDCNLIFKNYYSYSKFFNDRFSLRLLPKVEINALVRWYLFLMS